MNDYMMIFRNEKPTSHELPSAEQMQAVMQQWQSWISGIAKQGRFTGTNRLLPEGKTVRPDKVITDGPFIEGKEMVGGYLIVKAPNLEEAVEMAKSCPGLLYGSNVEVRSVMHIDYEPTSKNFLQEKELVN